MGDKVYKPIIKEGDHLLSSKETPGRVRGLTRDENNQNPDIIEWEEVDEQLDLDEYEERLTQLDEQRAELENQISNLLVETAITVGIVALPAIVTWWTDTAWPWWTETAWPWLKKAGRNIKEFIFGTEEKATPVQKQVAATTPDATQLEAVSKQLDVQFERLYIDMDEEEARTHIIKIIYHMIEIAREIRLLSSARLRKECESDEQYLEGRLAMEVLLIDKVANSINRLLSENSKYLDASATQRVFELTGGGIYHDEVYVPVNPRKIQEALQSNTIQREVP